MGDVRLLKEKKCLLIGRRGAITTLSLRAQQAGGRRATGASSPPGDTVPPSAQGRREPARSPEADERGPEAARAVGSGIS